MQAFFLHLLVIKVIDVSFRLFNYWRNYYFTRTFIRVYKVSRMLRGFLLYYTWFSIPFTVRIISLIICVYFEMTYFKLLCKLQLHNW
jgi:hypothetical protein